MNRLRCLCIIFLLIISWLVLAWLTGNRTPWHKFAATEQGGAVSVYLGDVPPQSYDRMGFTRALVRYSAKENAWVVGTERGELFLFDNEGRRLWRRNLGIGKIVSLCLSRDGALAVVGEQSPEGKLFAIDVTSGELRWQHKMSDIIGSEAGQRSYPAPVHIVMDKENNIYANAYRFLMDKRGARAYSAKTLALNADGKILWSFPKDELMDSWINWCDVNDKNGRVVVSTSAYAAHKKMKYKDTMYFLDRRTGELINSVRLAPLAPFESTVMRGSPCFGADGKLLAGSASDGRGFLFDERGKILWTRHLSRPTQLDGSWINAGGRDGYVTPYGIIFTTINTFNRENWQLPTPVEHPGSNSIFAFNEDGGFRFQYRAEGTMEEIDFAEHLVACAIGRNVRTHNYKAHGALLLDLRDGKRKNFFPTEGPLQAIALSSDGALVAGIEAPAATPRGEVLGAYRLHIWKNK